MVPRRERTLLIMSLTSFERGDVGADVARISDVTAFNGDARTIRIYFFRADLAHNLGVCDFFAAVGWDDIVVDD